MLVNKLKALGFGEQQCIEAYLVCNKDQELAINFLLDNADNNAQNQGQGNQGQGGNQG